MKRIVGLNVIFIGFLAVGLIAGPSVILKVKVQTANVRSEPDMSSESVAQVKFGTLLESSNKVGDFYEISITDKDGRTVYGFIHASVVEVLGTEEEKVTKEVKKVKEPEPEPMVKPQRVEPAYAEFKKMGLGLFVGGSSTSDYGSGLAFGANFYFGITKNIGIEVGGLRLQTTTKDNDDMTKLSKGKLTVMPLQLSLMARFPVGAKIVPYIAAGGGYYLNSFTLDAAIVKSWDDLGFDLEEAIDNAFGFHFGAGLDFFVNPNIAITAGVKYCLAKAKGSWTMQDQVSSEETKETLADLKLNALVFGAGLKYFF
jgi:outer membrane protein